MHLIILELALKGCKIKVFEVIILGGGASGLMCAHELVKSGMDNIAIIDANSAVGEKIKISGGGKCNITNTQVSEKNYLGDEKLLHHALKAFSKKRLLEMLYNYNIELEIRKERYYFCKKSAKEVVAMLTSPLSPHHFYLNEKILHVAFDTLFTVTTSNQKFCAKKVVVATGGESFKQLGASDIGLVIAQSFGDRIQRFSPALVGLTLQKEQAWMKTLSGVSFFVKIKVCEKELSEEMLFAHKGISGPAVLSASLYWSKGSITIDFMPNHTIEKVITKGNKKLSNALPLPKRFIQTFLKVIDVEDKECSRLTYIEKKKLNQIHEYTFAPAGNFGFAKAEVSRGGVISDDIDPHSMQSRHQKNLFYIGEVVDMTGELGGYNFQWAFSSALNCANFIKNC